MASTDIIHSDVRQFNTADIMGIFLTETNGHSGILCYDEDQPGQEFLYHMVYSGLDQMSPLPPKYFWVDMNLHKIRKRIVAAFCKEAYEAQQRNEIIYAFSDPRNSFSKDAIFLYSAKNGFTCTNFVFAVLHTLGHDLVDLNSWPPATSDDIKQRLNSLSNVIRFKVIPTPKIYSMLFEIVNPRLTPKQLTAAATIFPPTVSYSDCCARESAIFTTPPVTSAAPP